MRDKKCFVKEEKSGKENKKISAIRILAISIYTLCLCLLSVFLTVLIQNQKYSNNPIGPYLKPGTKADKEYLDENFDVYFAFCESTKQIYTLEVFLNSNLLSKEDKKVFADQKNTYFDLNLGIKDGVDIVEITRLGYSPYVYQFKSNLNYSFESIIKEFEEMSGQKLTEEFLKGSYKDSVINSELLGIIVEFKRLENDTFGIYFRTTINGIVYVIDK